MNREIKFRAWGAVSKEIIGWDQLRPNLSLAFEQAKRDAIILMQFTGLKDTQGRGIYEGDIVKLADWIPNTYQVGFDRGGFCFYREGETFYNDAKYLEDALVIGNIYENSDLLETN